MKDSRLANWFARIVLGVVLGLNLTCALAFVLRPGEYAPGFELAGAAGDMAVRGFGILFLMWNATYPLVILYPVRQRALFAVVLVQQAIGLAGETWLLAGLPAGHTALRDTGLRFIAFDASGLLLMLAAYFWVHAAGRWKDR
jgi:hypothetical protein